MSVVFRKTSQGLFVISPMGLLSPVSFVTDNEMDIAKARSTYMFFMGLTVFAMGAHYKWANDNTNTTTWAVFGIIFLLLIVGMYISFLVRLSNVSVYSEARHGKIIKK